MGQAAASPYVLFEDYFEKEAVSAASEPRHEWFDGVVYAMSRGTPEHGRLASRITIALAGLLPKGCELYSADTMLFVERANLATYADVTVVCGPREVRTVRKNGRSLGQAITNATALIEVLSESTERYDRDGKFAAYKQMASLEEYVLVSPNRVQIEVFRRANNWVGELREAGHSVRIHGIAIPVDAIFGAA